MSNDGTYGDEIALRSVAELFNIEFILVSTLGKAVEVTLTLKNFSPQKRAFLAHFAGNQGGHYVVLGQIDDFESSEVVTPTLDRPVDFEVSTTAPRKLFAELPPELIKRILLTAKRNCRYVWSSHVVHASNALQNVCKFWRIEVDANAMK